MKVLVTGATGFVAGHLIPHLVGAGHHVVATGHDRARLERFPGAEPIVFDLRERRLAGVLPERLDAIIHLAQANVPYPEGAADLFDVNVGSTQRLLEYGRQAGVNRFVYASSGSVYGPGDRPWREDDPAVGPGYYAATKQAAERLVDGYGGEFPSTIIRLFAPYGPGQQRRLIPGLIERVRAGRPVDLREGGRPRVNPVYVTHVDHIIEQALAVRGSQVVNLGGDEVLSIRDMAEIIGRELGLAPVYQEVAGSSGGDTVGDTTRLRRLFRLPNRLITFADGVRAMLAVQNAK